MKAHIAAVTLVAGTLSSATLADHTVPAFGPLNVLDTTQYINLNGGSIPAATYRSYSMSIVWQDNGPGSYSSEVWPGLSSTGSSSGTSYTFPLNGKNSTLNELSRTLQWDAALRTSYVGGQPLFFSATQFVDPSLNIPGFPPFVPDTTWTSVTLTLQTAARTAPTTFTDVGTTAFPAIGQPFGTQSYNSELVAGEVKWFRFTVPAPGVTAGNGNFVDMNSNFTSLTPGPADTLLFLYDSNGLIIAADDDDGENNNAALSFGGTSTPRPRFDTTEQPYNGRDGALPAGTYWAAVASDGVLNQGINNREPLTVAHDGWAVTSQSSRTGIAWFTITWGAVNPQPTCVASETEPNDTKSTAQAVTFTNAFDAICATSTGADTTGTASSVDYFKILVPRDAAGLPLRHRVRLVTTAIGIPHSMSMRGLSQIAGVVDTASDANISSAVASTSPQRFLQFYTLGTELNPFITARVFGSTTTTDPYQIVYDGSAPVTITDVNGGDFTAGPITFTSFGTTGATSTDTDIAIYDSNFNPIPNYSNDDPTSVTGGQPASFTRSFQAGTYYIAISNFDLMNNQPSASDEGRPSKGNVLDSAGVIVSSSSTPLPSATAPVGLDFLMYDSTNAQRFIFNNKAGSYDVNFFRFTVAGGETLRCSPADIAYGDGEPLPPYGQPGGFNPAGPDGGDFDCFFNFYFSPSPENAVCDIAYGDGEPQPPFGPAGGFNPGVDGGDFDCFFNFYFNGCL